MKSIRKQIQEARSCSDEETDFWMGELADTMKPLSKFDKAKLKKMLFHLEKMCCGQPEDKNKPDISIQFNNSK